MSTKLNKNPLPKCKMFVSVKVPCVLYLCGTRVDAVPGDFFTLTPNDSENPFVFGVEIERILNYDDQVVGDVVSIIESRLSELLGDAQPNPVLRYELLDLVKRVKSHFGIS